MCYDIYDSKIADPRTKSAGTRFVKWPVRRWFDHHTVTKGPSTYRDEVANVVPDVDPHRREQRCGAMEQSWFSPTYSGLWSFMWYWPDSLPRRTNPTNINDQQIPTAGRERQWDFRRRTNWTTTPGDQGNGVHGKKMNTLCDEGRGNKAQSLIWHLESAQLAKSLVKGKSLL